MNLHELTYSSLATRDLQLNELADLLAQAREKNARLGISGLLIYRDKEFIQLLEGDKATVFAMYETICGDSRNTRNYLMWDEAISQRSFAEWSMGFVTPAELELKDLPGYADFFQSGFNESSRRPNGSVGKRFLAIHREVYLRQQQALRYKS